MLSVTVRRPVVAILTAVGIAFSGMPITAAAAAIRERHGLPALVAGDQQAFLQSIPRVSLPVDLDHARAVLVRSTRSSHPLLAARATRALLWLDILTAKSAAERHEMIRRLPVTILRERATSGPAGTTVSYVAGGKTRFQRFIPAGMSGEVAATSNGGPSSGPFAAPVADDCYDGPPPCATWAEMDDLGIEIAAAQADVASAEQEYNDTCANIPEACGDTNDSRRRASGPSGVDSSDFACAAEAGNALTALAGSTGSLLALWLGHSAAVASGLALTAAGVVVVLGIIASAGFVVGYYVGVWLHCALQLEPSSTGGSACPAIVEPIYE